MVGLLVIEVTQTTGRLINSRTGQAVPWTAACSM